MKLQQRLFLENIDGTRKFPQIESFVKIGYDNTEFLKMIIEKETTVRWHFRDQPYGPGRTLRKKILIVPHVRKYKNLAT